MRPPHNKPTMGRTPLAKGIYPPLADSGQVPSIKEDKLAKALASSAKEN